MCGLAGWYFNRLDRKQIPLASALAVTMDLRGEDSWGFYGYTWNAKDGTRLDNPILRKGLGWFAENVSARSLKKFSVLMMHSRDASAGMKVSVENAHPFDVGNIIGAHNGIIRNHSELNKQYGRKFECDSLHIFEHLDKGLPLKELCGYGAITYFNKKKPDRLHLARWNTNGVLSAADVFDARGKQLGVAWASVKEHLAASLNSAGFEFKMRILDPSVAYFIEPDQADGIPKVWYVKGTKYEFGNEYPHFTVTHTSWSGPDYTTKAYCLKCGVADDPNYHKQGSNHSVFKGLDGIQMLIDEPDRITGKNFFHLQAIKQFHQTRIPQGSVMGENYIMLQSKDDMWRPIWLSGSLPDKDPKGNIPSGKDVKETVIDANEIFTCQYCGGPGPMTKLAKFEICISCRNEFSKMDKSQKKEMYAALQEMELNRLAKEEEEIMAKFMVQGSYNDA